MQQNQFEEWHSMYIIPPNERGTFYIWLKHKGLDREIVIHNSDDKVNELGIVIGFQDTIYSIWKSQWNNSFTVPSMIYSPLNKALSVNECDDFINKNPDISRTDDIFKIKENLIYTMVYPYLHESFNVSDSGLTYSLYDTKKTLDKLYLLANKFPPMSKLYLLKQVIYTNLLKKILLDYYNYNYITT